jgi:hypothetical protein
MRINLKRSDVIYGHTHSPENIIFIQGRTNDRIIKLPEEWKEIVNWKNISVHLTPYGMQQNLIVRRIDRENLEVHVQSQGCPTMDYFYMIMAERMDIPKPGTDA